MNQNMFRFKDYSDGIIGFINRNNPGSKTLKSQEIKSIFGKKRIKLHWSDEDLEVRFEEKASMEGVVYSPVFYQKDSPLNLSAKEADAICKSATVSWPEKVVRLPIPDWANINDGYGSFIDADVTSHLMFQSEAEVIWKDFISKNPFE